MSSRTRLVLFLILAACCVTVAVVAVVSGVDGDDDPATNASAGADRALVSARAENRPMVLFRSLGKGAAKDVSQVELSPAAAAGTSVTRSPLACARVYFAGG